MIFWYDLELSVSVGRANNNKLSLVGMQLLDMGCNYPYIFQVVASLPNENLLHFAGFFSRFSLGSVFAEKIEFS